MTYIPNRDFLIEVAKGNISGHSLIHKFGRNSAVANAAWEFVSGLGQGGLAVHAPHLQTATTVRVKVGGHVEDDQDGGDNAREVTIEGLDENGDLASEAVNTEGADVGSSTTTTFIRVFRAYVSASGTYGAANAGNITIENTAGTLDLIRLVTWSGQSLYGGYTIPLGKTGYIAGLTFTVESMKPANFILFRREDILDTGVPVSSPRLLGFWNGIIDTLSPKLPAPHALPALTDIWVEALGDGAQTGVSVDLTILLVDD